MREARLIVDFQNDLTPGGALAVPHGDEISDRAKELIDSERFDLVVATRDWHPIDHSSFEERGGPWPPHCVQNTEGAQLHPALDPVRIDVVVDKGDDPDTEGYSGFQDTDLAGLLREHEIESVMIVGLTTDYCVRHTALDALREGFRVTVDPAGVRGIDPGDSERALKEVRESGGVVATPA